MTLQLANNDLKNSSKVIKRAVILDGIKALCRMQHKFDRFISTDNYGCGYREGFEDALIAVAQIIGATDELEEMQKKLHTYDVTHLKLYQDDTLNEKDPKYKLRV